MEAVLKIIRAQVDKFARFNVHKDAIVYTTKSAPKVKHSLGTTDAKRMFEDLYGSTALRWTASKQHRPSSLCRFQYRMANQ